MAVRALAAVAVLTIGIAAVAYAATSPRRGGVDRRAPAADAQRPPAPRITTHPPAIATSPTARFRFLSSVGNARFECRLDGGAWAGCTSPAIFRQVGAGAHVFRVRALVQGLRGKSGRASWQRVEPREFSITTLFSSIDPLYPGAAPQALPLRLDNPNPVPILITGLRVGVAMDPPWCDAATNLELIPAGVSGARPLRLPPGGSASIPSPGFEAPAIRLRDLPVNQDACQNAQFPLVFKGVAKG